MPIHVGEHGHLFRRRIRALNATTSVVSAFNLTGATLVFHFRSPVGTTKTLVGSVTDAAAGIADATTTLGFLDKVGAWKWWVKVTSAAGVWYTEPETFEVEPTPPST